MIRNLRTINKRKQITEIAAATMVILSVFDSSTEILVDKTSPEIDALSEADKTSVSVFSPRKMEMLAVGVSDKSNTPSRPPSTLDGGVGVVGEGVLTGVVVVEGVVVLVGVGDGVDVGVGVGVIVKNEKLKDKLLDFSLVGPELLPV